MAPLFVLLASTAFFLGLRAAGFAAFHDPRLCLRAGLALMFLLTASAHWGRRRADLVKMVPPAFPRPALLVALTGWAELAGAAGLLWPRLAPWAAGALALLLLAMLPANLHAAEQRLSIGGRPVMRRWPRVALQAAFIAALLAAGFPS
jgi:uncharacterized membrane protein